MKVRRIRLTSAATLLLSIATVAGLHTPERASAWGVLYCRIGANHVKYYVTSNTTPQTNLLMSAREWGPGSVTGVSFDKVNVKSERNTYANNKSFGYTGWSGMLHDVNDFGNPSCNSNGRWNSSTIMVSVNNAYNANSAVRRRGVATHEFGHLLGLAHENATSPCQFGGSNPNYRALMYATDARFNGECAVFTPRADDRAGIAALY